VVLNLGSRLAFGVEGLDKLFSDVMRPPVTIVVAGNPGAGKTTLASTICYYNALNGHKCLYVSLQEDREKLFSNMKNLGIDLEPLERKGLVKFIKFPLYSDVSEIANEINNSISTENFSIIVIDSINPLLQAVESDYAKRAWLQNYFCSLAKLVSGVVVLVAELPFGRKRVELGAIEFVVDAVVILKHSIERGLVSRSVEVRKARGAPLHIAEMPFSIQQGKGIIVYVPPVLEEIAREGREIEIPCKEIKSRMSMAAHLHRGMVIYIAYPPDARPLDFVPLFMGVAALNKMKVHVISYLYPPELVRLFIYRSFYELIDKERFERLVSNFVMVHSLNPFTYSLSELLHKELTMISEDDDIVAFHGVDVLWAVMRSRGEYLQNLYNQLNYLKSRQKLIIRMGSVISEEMYRVNAALSDLVMRFELEHKDGDTEYKVYIWRRGLEKPFVLRENELARCIAEVAEKIVQADIQ
jgi:circadian clock protein KaiC